MQLDDIALLLSVLAVSFLFYLLARKMGMRFRVAMRWGLFVGGIFALALGILGLLAILLFSQMQSFIFIGVGVLWIILWKVTNRDEVGD